MTLLETFELHVLRNGEWVYHSTHLSLASAYSEGLIGSDVQIRTIFNPIDLDEAAEVQDYIQNQKLRDLVQLWINREGQ